MGEVRPKVYPRSHRSTSQEEGLDKNFAGLFPFIDLIFGTFYMPKQVLPAAYGVADPTFPGGFGAQMIYPFKQ